MTEHQPEQQQDVLASAAAIIDGSAERIIDNQARLEAMTPHLQAIEDVAPDGWCVLTLTASEGQVNRVEVVGRFTDTADMSGKEQADRFAESFVNDLSQDEGMHAQATPLPMYDPDTEGDTDG